MAYKPRHSRASNLTESFRTRAEYFYTPLSKAIRQTRIRDGMPTLKNNLVHDYKSSSPTRKVKPGEEPNLVISLAEGETAGEHSIHFPCFDLDYGAKLVPSQTLGHYHLYLNRPIPWRDYKKVLDVFAKVGLLEKGYVDASKKNGFTALRPPLSHIKEMIVRNGMNNKENKTLSELLGVESGVTGSDLIGGYFDNAKAIEHTQEDY